MKQMRAYVQSHRLMCILQVVLLALLAVVGLVYKQTMLFPPFLVLTLLTWWNYKWFRWPFYSWGVVFLGLNGWAAHQYEFLAQMTPGDYSLGFSLLIVLLLVLFTFSGNRPKRSKDIPAPPRSIRHL